MEHVQAFDRRFSWRGAALAAALVLVIALAVLAGMALLHRIGGTRPAAAARRAASHAATSRTVPLRSRSRISVLVLNGNGIAGAAGREATRLLGRGYRRLLPANAPGGYSRSLVLFRPGWGREAERLARDAGIAAVAPLDGSLPSADAGYQLVVILGASS